MGRFGDILDKTADLTNTQLATQISSLTALKDSQINSLFPAKSDKENLLQLLDIVNAATDENKKITQLRDNIEAVAGTVIKLVKVLM